MNKPKTAWALVIGLLLVASDTRAGCDMGDHHYWAVELGDQGFSFVAFSDFTHVLVGPMQFGVSLSVTAVGLLCGVLLLAVPVAFVLRRRRG